MLSMRTSIITFSITMTSYYVIIVKRKTNILVNFSQSTIMSLRQTGTAVSDLSFGALRTLSFIGIDSPGGRETGKNVGVPEWTHGSL